MAILVAAVVGIVKWNRPQKQVQQVARTEVLEGGQAHSSALVGTNAIAAPPTNAQTTSASGSSVLSNYPDFQLRPFAVAQENRLHQWTKENGRELGVIRQLAHSDLEYQRMLEESARIQRRQLVYRMETAAAVVQRSRATGQPVNQLTLPAFDGQEVVFEINQSDLNPSGLQGTFSGIVAGRPDSTVTLAFKGNREAFTVLSPSDKLYIVSEPREPGELILKQIDPETYTAGAFCGNQ
jgi:hypothetical protein